MINKINCNGRLIKAMFVKSFSNYVFMHKSQGSRPHIQGRHYECDTITHIISKYESGVLATSG